MKVKTNKKLLSLIMTLTVISSFFVPVAHAATTFTTTKVDSNLTRIKVTSNRWASEQTLEFTPDVTGQYALFMPPVNLDRVYTGRQVTFTVTEKESENAVLFDGVNASVTEALNNSYMYRIGNDAGGILELTKDVTYVIKTTAVDNTKVYPYLYLDVRRLSFDIYPGEKVAISASDFVKSSDTGNRFNGQNFQTISLDPIADYTLLGNYASETLTAPYTSALTHRYGSAEYKISIKEKGTYTFKVDGKRVNASGDPWMTMTVKDANGTNKLNKNQGGFSTGERVQNVYGEVELQPGDYTIALSDNSGNIWKYAILIESPAKSSQTKIDSNLTRLQWIGANNGDQMWDTTKTYEFTPETTGKYALFVPPINLNAVYTGRQLKFTVTDRESGAVVKFDKTSDYITETLSNVNMYRVGNSTGGVLELTKGKTYRIKTEAVGSNYANVYLDVRKLSFEVGVNEKVAISTSDFVSSTDADKKFNEQNFVTVDLAPISGYTLLGNYAEATPAYNRGFNVRYGATTYDIVIKEDGLYTFSLYGGVEGDDTPAVAMSLKTENGVAKINSNKTFTENSVIKYETVRLAPGKYTLSFNDVQQARKYAILIDSAEAIPTANVEFTTEWNSETTQLQVAASYACQELTDGATLYVVFYDGSDRFLNVTSQPSTQNSDFTFDFPGADIPENAVSAKAFLWENSTLKPLCGSDTLQKSAATVSIVSGND